MKYSECYCADDPVVFVFATFIVLQLLALCNVNDCLYCFTIGTASTMESPFSSGISSKLNYEYKANDDSTFFDQLMKVPDFTRSCPIDVYLSLTEFLTVKQISLHSSCIELKIGNLPMPSGLELALILPGEQPSSNVGMGSIGIAMKLMDAPVLRLSHLISLLPNSNSDLVNLVYRSTNKVSGTISRANVSVLDSQLTTSISVEN